jgi:hypothetical protein
MMIWGCMTSNGLGDACWLPKGPDSQLYVEVLQDYVLLSRDYCGIDPEKFAFQQDNAKVHTAHIVKEYFSKSKIPVFKWPDNGKEFFNQVTKIMTEQMGIHHRLVTPYHTIREAMD